MASSSSVRKAACFVLALSIFVCSRHANSQRRSVCGKGPHTLDLTGLDIYLLSNTFVTVQVVSLQHNSNNVLWYGVREKDNMLVSKQKWNGSNLRIGPMSKKLNLLCIRYGYRKSGSTIPRYVSNTACLYLIESDFKAFPDKGFTNGQVVHVTTGSTRRVICYRRTPANNDTGIYTAPVDLVLFKRKGTVKNHFHFSFVGFNRYYENNSCVWMVSLQPEDAGTYRLEISDCFGSDHSTIDIDFSLSVSQSATPSQSSYSTTQHLLLHHGTTESTTSPSQISESAVSSLTPKPSFRLPTTLSSISSQTLQLTLESGRAYNTYVNSKLTVKYHVSGRSSRQLTVTVRHNETDARRVVVNRFNLTIINVLQSDSGLYQVIVRDSERTATVDFNVNVQEVTMPPSTNTASEPTRTNVSYGLMTNSPGASSTENGWRWVSGSGALSTDCNKDALIASVALLFVLFVLAVIIAVRYRILWRSAQIPSIHMEKESARQADPVYESVEEDRIRQATDKAARTSVQSDTKITSNPAYGKM